MPSLDANEQNIDFKKVQNQVWLTTSAISGDLSHTPILSEACYGASDVIYPEILYYIELRIGNKITQNCIHESSNGRVI